jgi:hypothetical protein
MLHTTAFSGDVRDYGDLKTARRRRLTILATVARRVCSTMIFAENRPV